MKEKALIFDAGTIINFSMNGLLNLLPKLKKEFNGRFLITGDVEYEIIKRPMNIKKFKLGALKIKKLLDDKVIELSDSIGVKTMEIEDERRKILEFANHTFFGEGKAIHLIDLGEASCLVLSDILTKKGIDNLIVIDERTTRMLCEKPENLHKLLETKLHTKVEMKKENLRVFSKFKFIRSAELVFTAYKKGLVDLKNRDVLDALLYAVKYKGCSISREEIEQMKKL
tara:strand:+ start:408 stop:1088 length:681 start_codon:yes stop_codon:yes gene_type:complete